MGDCDETWKPFCRIVLITRRTLEFNDLLSGITVARGHQEKCINLLDTPMY